MNEKLIKKLLTRPLKNDRERALAQAANGIGQAITFLRVFTQLRLYHTETELLATGCIVSDLDDCQEKICELLVNEKREGGCGE